MNNRIISVMIGIITVILFFWIGADLYGPYAVKEYWTLFFFGIVGFGMSLQHSVNRRDVIGEHKPKRFSYLYMILDNVFRIINVSTMLLIAIRFLPQKLSNVESGLVALVLGFGIDRLPIILKYISNWAWNKIQSMFTDAKGNK